MDPKQVSQLLELKPRREQPARRRIYGVPPLVRRRSHQNNKVYEPQLVSFGPYHHGKPEFHQAEEFKYLCLDWCAWGDDTIKGFFYNKVLDTIDEIRSCYTEESIVKMFDDKSLALMMLLDACFIINFMLNIVEAKRCNFREWWKHLGVAASARFVNCDIMVLENQIPFQVVKMLVIFMYENEEEEAHELIDKFLCRIVGMEQNQATSYREYAEPPVHILEACGRVIAGKFNAEGPHHKEGSSHFWQCGKYFARRVEEIEHTCRSVMDLKDKGINFKPSSSSFLTNITFKSGLFSAELQLPPRYVSDLYHVFMTNMIAFEISPNTRASEPIVLSYIIFMKSLIETPEDVKELQENGVLFNRYANHGQAVKVLKEIDTFELLNLDIFTDIKQNMEKHCSSTAKTWIADFVNTWFRKSLDCYRSGGHRCSSPPYFYTDIFHHSSNVMKSIKFYASILKW